MPVFSLVLSTFSLPCMRCPSGYARIEGFGEVLNFSLSHWLNLLNRRVLLVIDLTGTVEEPNGLVGEYSKYEEHNPHSQSDFQLYYLERKLHEYSVTILWIQKSAWERWFDRIIVFSRLTY